MKGYKRKRILGFHGGRPTMRYPPDPFFKLINISILADATSLIIGSRTRRRIPKKR